LNTYLEDILKGVEETEEEVEETRRVETKDDMITTSSGIV